MAVGEVQDHQQVTLQRSGTQHPLFWPLPGPQSQDPLGWISFSQGKATEAPPGMWPSGGGSGGVDELGWQGLCKAGLSPLRH